VWHSQPQSHFIPTRLWRWNRQSVPKRWHLNYRRREITQKKAYDKTDVLFIPWKWYSSFLRNDYSDWPTNKATWESKHVKTPPILSTIPAPYRQQKYKVLWRYSFVIQLLYILGKSPLYSLNPLDSPHVPFVESNHSTFLHKTVYIYGKCLISVHLHVDMCERPTRCTFFPIIYFNLIILGIFRTSNCISSSGVLYKQLTVFHHAS
jgi:hypothetical protein